MRNVTIVLKYQITEEQSDSEDFIEFVNSIRSGKLQRELESESNKDYKMQHVTMTIEVSKKQKRL